MQIVRPAGVLRLLLLTLLTVSAAMAQPDAGRVISQESRGKDFWVCFPQNARFERFAGLNFRLFITGDKATTGQITVPGLGITKRFAIGPSEILPIDIDSVVQVLGSDQIQKVGIHVEADNPIAVYGLSHRPASTDTYLALPTNTLGKVYRGVGYYPLSEQDMYSSQMTWVATEDGTLVTITLSGETRGGHRAGETYTVKMQKGDVYQIQSINNTAKRSDLTGTLVVSNKPIAFFAGHTCAQVPTDVFYCNQLLEQEPPVPSWGRQFYVGRLEGKAQYVIRVVASEPNTQVFVDNHVVAKLKNAGEFYENNHLKENTFITANKPVIVAEYAQGSDADSIKIGDPNMFFITPTEQFLNYYRFATPIKGSWHHFINLVVPTDALSSLRLDGLTLSPKYFKTIGISRYAIAQIEVGYGSHSIRCEQPFGLYSYGFGVAEDNFDSYGNNGGQLVQTIPDVPDTLHPVLDLVSDDANGPLAMIARDDRLFDAGLESITVIDSSNFKSPVMIPPFDAGTPELPLYFKVRDTAQCGFMSLKVVDVAKNEGYYVICRTQVNNVWTYQVYEGKGLLCPSCKSWTIQLTATPSATISNVTFNPPSYLKGGDVFNDFTSQISGSIALSYIYPFSKKFMLSGGIGFSNYNGTANALHSSFANDSIYYGGDTAGARKIKVVEQFSTNISLSYLSLKGGFYHYFIPEKLYFYGGLSADILLSASYTETSEILYPATLDYNTSIDPERKSTGVRSLTVASGSLPNPTHFQLALELSPGAQFKLNKNFSLLTGLYLNMPLFDAVTDLNWHLSTFGARIGLIYRN
ncbi:MAG: hypothetical protein JSS75_12720 [Bacteroidetes bacterium]|nr:hypothetical protein [Bacteroidota bacterium]